ncbi:accessory Sec system glycosyltransferase GtfB [uncultured Streptococcus sp.]|uniref:accessory Sec system glycosyltransferase GtfB n=1 Tax=uncultured Streptococcus sp. TaxID=83427 RepID=UPI0028DCC245|nr:accessory Sec system glycosyltransferase GtfB [uncultured Streptococcus sp.]
MLLIAQEPSQVTDKLRRLLDSFGIHYRVFYTNFETDVDKATISLASSFIYSSDEDYQGKPLFFNDLSVPLYWELWTLGITTYIFDGQDRRASIIFRENLKDRTVKQVHWFGQGEKVLAIDDYNRYGWRTKQRLQDDEGQALIDIYFNRHQEEVLLHYIQEGHLIDQGSEGRDRIFSGKEELTKAVLTQILKSDEPIICMDSNLIPILQLQHPNRLVYCSASHDGLEHIQNQVSHTLIADYYPQEERRPNLIYLAGAEQEGAKTFTPQAMVMTASENIEGLADLVDAFPNLNFHIAAQTSMGPKLTCLEGKVNVHLYPGIGQEQYQELLRKSSIYLDLNYGSEVSDVTLDAIENEHLLYGLESTVHRPYYKTLPTVYTSYEELEQGFRQLLQQADFYSNALESQKEILKLAERGEILAFLTRLEGEKDDDLHL